VGIEDFRRTNTGIDPDMVPLFVPDGPPSRTAPRDTQPAQRTGGEMPPERQSPKPDARSADPTNPLKDRMGLDAGPYNIPFLADRTIAAVASAAAAQRDIPMLAERMAAGAKYPSVGSLYSVRGDEWMKAGSTQVGKIIGGALIADTALDLTLFSDRTTSWRTWAVDGAAPFFAKTLLARFGFAGGLVASVGAHAAEKWFLEEKR
jgi:hypothetical protein